MAPQKPHTGGIDTESSQTTGTSSNVSLAETLQQYRHQLVHRDGEIAATDNMTLDANSKQYMIPDAAILGSNMRSDVSSSILM